MKTMRKPGAERLAKGQLWKMKHAYVLILGLGKRLLQYKMLSRLGESGVRAKFSDVAVMRDYLLSRHACLVRTGLTESF